MGLGTEQEPLPTHNSPTEGFQQDPGKNHVSVGWPMGRTDTGGGWYMNHAQAARSGCAASAGHKGSQGTRGQGTMAGHFVQKIRVPAE